jgi:hypothetical protein
MKYTNPINQDLRLQIDRFDSMDNFDRSQLMNTILLQNQNSREGMEIYKYAQDKGLV